MGHDRHRAGYGAHRTSSCDENWHNTVSHRSRTSSRVTCAGRPSRSLQLSCTARHNFVNRKAGTSRSSMTSSHRYSTACSRTESRHRSSMTITIKSSHCYPGTLRHHANGTGFHISRRKCSRTLWQQQIRNRPHHVTCSSATRLPGPEHLTTARPRQLAPLIPRPTHVRRDAAHLVAHSPLSLSFLATTPRHPPPTLRSRLHINRDLPPSFLEMPRQPLVMDPRSPPVAHLFHPSGPMASRDLWPRSAPQDTMASPPQRRYFIVEHHPQHRVRYHLEEPQPLQTPMRTSFSPSATMALGRLSPAPPPSLRSPTRYCYRRHRFPRQPRPHRICVCTGSRCSATAFSYLHVLV